MNVVILITPRILEMKADSLWKLESSRTEYAMASVWFTTGVLDQYTYSKG